MLHVTTEVGRPGFKGEAYSINKKNQTRIILLLKKQCTNWFLIASDEQLSFPIFIIFQYDQDKDCSTSTSLFLRNRSALAVNC